jgi:hypothetical protein
MVFTMRFDISRLQVMAMNPNLIPHAVNVVISDSLYELVQGRVQHRGMLSPTDEHG